MDYRNNCDHLDYADFGPSQGQIIDVLFSDESGDLDPIISVADFKVFAGIELDYSENDTLIGSILIAAEQMCEKAANIGFRERVVTCVMNNGNGGNFLPYGPVGEVTEVLSYESVIEDPDVQGVKWKQLMNRGQRMTVTYTGGYSTLPKDLRLVLLNAAKYLYDNRAEEGMDSIGPIAKMLLNPISRNE